MSDHQELPNLPRPLVEAMEVEAKRRNMPFSAVVAEKLLRAGHVNPFALEPHAVEVRLRCMELAARWMQGATDPMRYFTVCGQLEDFAHSGMAIVRMSELAKPEPEPAPEPEPEEIFPPLTKANVVSVCRSLLAAGQRQNLELLDICAILEFNPTSFGNWSAGNMLPRPHNFRKLVRCLRKGFGQRPNGVDTAAMPAAAP